MSLGVRADRDSGCTHTRVDYPGAFGAWAMIEPELRGRGFELWESIRAMINL